jgi:hypothetical protein
MFISQTKKGATIFNALIFFGLVVAAAVVALSLVKIKADPKSPGDFKNTLALGKKK